MPHGERTDHPEGPIVPNKEKDEIRADPYNMPPGFEWSTVDICDSEQRLELYNLLANNYVEDDDCLFRFDYSQEFWNSDSSGIPQRVRIGISDYVNDIWYWIGTLYYGLFSTFEVIKTETEPEHENDSVQKIFQKQPKKRKIGGNDWKFFTPSW